MDILKKFFPIAFQTVQKDTNSLVKAIVIHAVVLVAYSVLTAILGWFLPEFISWLLGLLGSVIGLYCTGGIVLSVLRYCNVLKDN
jgi:CHASE2 domain-containing sensor protein